jgi:Mg2+-importing ATPase
VAGLGDLQKFMLYIGPISSIFDYATYAVMWFVFQANTVEQEALFQTGWFVESPDDPDLDCLHHSDCKIPFLQSRAALPMLLVTLTIMAGCHLSALLADRLRVRIRAFTPQYFFWLALILSSYCLLTQLVKTWFVRRYGVQLTDVGLRSRLIAA